MKKVSLFKSKKWIPIRKLIKFYDFKDINQAFEDSHNGKVIKAVLKMV